jgi:F0F1-type ATP synthase assembly protein I
MTDRYPHRLAGVRAMPSARATHKPSLASRLGLSVGVAIARCTDFIAYNAPALILGFIAGVLAVVVLAFVIAQVIS